MIIHPKQRRVKVLRSFWYEGVATAVNATLALPNALAHELRHAGKVEFVDGDPQPVEVKPAPPPNQIPDDTPGRDAAPVKKGK